MIDACISPRDIDLALDILQYDADPMFLEAKLGTALASKIYDIQKGIRSVDPAELIKGARRAYQLFMENGQLEYGVELLTDIEQLKAKFAESGLTDEEIAGVMKGDE